MKKVLFFIILIASVSCVSQKQGQTIFQSVKGGDKYKFSIPKGYIDEKRFAGDNEYSQEYYYSDSSIFYITTFRNTTNYEEIRKQETYYQRFNALNEGDTITLKGINDHGLYWKDRLLKGGVTIGYSNVNSNSKSEFDKSVMSIKKLK